MRDDIEFKKLIVLPVGHFAPYEPPCFGDAAVFAVDWFMTHLRM